MTADDLEKLPEPFGISNDTIDHRLFVGGLAKGLRILDVLGKRQSPMSLTEISQESGFGKSSTQRIIYTLSALGYIKKDVATRRYLLAPKILSFAGGYLRSGGLAEKAFPYLLEANKLTDETVNLTEIDGTDIIYVARFPSRNIITSDITIGSRLPVFCTAPGQAMLSQMPRDRAMSILESAPREPRTPHTVTDIGEIVAKLNAAHERGFALAEQEAFNGEISIASAVTDRDGDVVGSVNIAVSLLRWKIADATKVLAPVVMEIAAAISRTLR
jgi:IclR family transcriptional regulator, pca regulon regulatory protein